MTEQKPGLHYAKLEVMRKVEYVQKATSKGLKYSFASEADLIHALRDAMIEAGIVMRPGKTVVVSQEHYDTKSGNQQKCVLLSRTFVFTHAPTGESEEIELIGEAADTGDKACGKAMTHAKKYALREYFMIETGDDPDWVADERGSENESLVRRAHALLAEPRIHKTLNHAWERLQKEYWESLSSDQQEKLRLFYLKRVKEMESVPQNKDQQS